MNTLADRIKARMDELGFTQDSLGEAVGISQTAIYKILSGQTESPRKIVQLAKALQCDATWLSTGIDPYKKLGSGLAALTGYDEEIKERVIQEINSNAVMLGGFDLWDSSTPLGDDEVALPFFREVKLAAGNGVIEVQENHGAKLRFSKSTLRNNNVNASDAACVNVLGNSMEPVLPDGTTVGIDTSQTEIVNGEMYAIDHCGHLRIKLLYVMPGNSIRIRSYNIDEWPDELVKPDDIRVIGWVFWYSVLRKRQMR